MFWSSKNSTYYDRGKKAYGHGDEIPEETIAQMGKETFDEYVKKGLIADGVSVAEAEKAAAEAKRESLFEEAISCGLKPHPNTGIAKLEVMIEDYKALQALKKEALALGIDPSDDVGFAELSELVEEKKADNESDS